MELTLQTGFFVECELIAWIDSADSSAFDGLNGQVCHVVISHENLC